MEILQSELAGGVTVMQVLGVVAALVVGYFALKAITKKPPPADNLRQRMACSACGWSGMLSKHKSRCAQCGSNTVLPSQEPACPFQFLGRAVPIDRVRAAYRDLPQMASIFPDPKSLPAKYQKTRPKTAR